MSLEEKLKSFLNIEIDELYVNAGLKGRNNSICIKHLGKVARRRAFRKHGRGL